MIAQLLAASPTVRPDLRVAELHEALRARRHESVQDVVVLQGERPVGLLPLETALAADEDRRVGELMRGAPLVVPVDVDREVAARAMVADGVRTLVVVDADGRYRGVVPAERMLAVLLAEHDEDLARLGGYARGQQQARGAAEEAVGRRLWHRLPWLTLGLLGAMGSALVVGAFDAKLEASVAIAFFVPAIVYMADAVGTQTETVLIRALAAGVTSRAIVARELLTGAIMGLAIGAAFFAFVAIGWSDLRIAAAVGLAMVASCSIATLVAMVLPSIFQRLGRDPAFGSGPLATVVQDLLSIGIYFAIVTLVV